MILRQRRMRLEVLGPVPGSAEDPGTSHPPSAAVTPADGAADTGRALPRRSEHRPVTSLDVLAMSDDELDEVTLAEVAHLMESTGAQVVDLVPGDLPPERMLRLLGRVDPEQLGTGAYAPGGGHEALVLHPSVTARLDVNGGEVDRGHLVRRTVGAQRLAPATVRIAPRLRASDWSARDRWRELDELHAAFRLYGDVPRAVVGFQTAHLLALAAGFALAPVPALAALASWTLQPSFVLGGIEGDETRPADLLRASAGRFAQVLSDSVRALAERPAPVTTAAGPQPDPAGLFEPRAETCPWCGSPSLTGRLDTTDLFQFKPGTFHLDECESCRHVFQNPRLTPAGLDHYYAEFYDGFGEELWERTFAAMGRSYDARVDVIASFTEPKAWLDVGAGHGHFCHTARRRWPGAGFDGLDMSDSILEAQRRGWIDRAHLGQFPDLAESLASSYDVVSMNHYLEHTREPRRELASAATVLVPGGHLLIEGPDAECPWARLGPYWRCWFQPQHQHFITCENLVTELERTGFEVVDVDRAGAAEGGNITVAALLLAMRLAGPPRLPWLPPPSPARRLLRPAVLAATLPMVGPAWLADQFVDGWERRPGTTSIGNAYRIVARRV